MPVQSTNIDDNEGLTNTNILKFMTISQPGIKSNIFYCVAVKYVGNTNIFATIFFVIFATCVDMLFWMYKLETMRENLLKAKLYENHSQTL